MNLFTDPKCLEIFNKPVGELLMETTFSQDAAVYDAIVADGKRVALVLATTNPKLIAALEKILALESAEK